MEQLEFFSVPNPCVGVCSTDPKGYCQGCMRKRDERFRWQSMSAAEQRYVIKLCQQRYRRKQAAASDTHRANYHDEKSNAPTNRMSVAQDLERDPQQDLFE